MGNLQSKLKLKFNKLKVVKRINKFLSVGPELEVVKAVITKAPNLVFGDISNVALNGHKGAVNISPHMIVKF